MPKACDFPLDDASREQKRGYVTSQKINKNRQTDKYRIQGLQHPLFPVCI